MIKIITEPTIRLVGRPQVDFAELGRFLEDEGASSWTTDTEHDGQRLIEVAGRLCYHSYVKPRPGGNKAYIGHILEVGHGSVIEHCNWNFIITGVSRSLTHELVRHRAGMAYSQRSQRYVDESNMSVVAPIDLVDEITSAEKWLANCGDADSAAEALECESNGVFIIPDKERAGLEWIASAESSVDSYQLMVGYFTNRDEVVTESGKHIITTGLRKKARGGSRSLLPSCAETQIFVTANARALRGVIEQRGVPGADAEIRRLAVAWAKMMIVEAPNIFQDYRIESDDDGEFVAFDFRKV